MNTHVRVLGWLYIILGILGVLGALLIFLIVAGAGWISGDRTAITITTIVAVVVAVFMILTSLPGIIAGIGLLNLREWARILAIVLGILNLPGFPVGTFLGAYTLYVMLDDDTSRLFAVT